MSALSDRLAQAIEAQPYVIDDSGDGTVCSPDEIIARRTGSDIRPVEILHMATFLDLAGNSEDASLWRSKL